MVSFRILVIMQDFDSDIFLFLDAGHDPEAMKKGKEPFHVYIL